jgi:hypothetical protein
MKWEYRYPWFMVALLSISIGAAWLSPAVVEDKWLITGVMGLIMAFILVTRKGYIEGLTRRDAFVKHLETMSEEQQRRYIATRLREVYKVEEVKEEQMN